MTSIGTSRTCGTGRTGGATAARMSQRGTGTNGVRASGLRGGSGEGTASGRQQGARDLRGMLAGGRDLTAGAEKYCNMSLRKRADCCGWGHAKRNDKSGLKSS